MLKITEATRPFYKRTHLEGEATITSPCFSLKIQTIVFSQCYSEGNLGGDHSNDYEKHHLNRSRNNV
jgi:hypothetical protein